MRDFFKKLGILVFLAPSALGIASQYPPPPTPEAIAAVGCGIFLRGSQFYHGTSSYVLKPTAPISEINAVRMQAIVSALNAGFKDPQFGPLGNLVLLGDHLIRNDDGSYVASASAAALDVSRFTKKQTFTAKVASSIWHQEATDIQRFSLQYDALMQAKDSCVRSGYAFCAVQMVSMPVDGAKTAGGWGFQDKVIQDVSMGATANWSFFGQVGNNGYYYDKVNEKIKQRLYYFNYRADVQVEGFSF